ncbi:hypothetical protein [Paucisalibacillus sp. EB02]|uniref:hypothetical protein n=1 Tax=Paucisalibacillus sp. EB02 TaxID=1347087 RepID=UPI0004B064B7|nr:hypothetical protein [Paucisalibacillus sp. EB02]
MKKKWGYIIAFIMLLLIGSQIHLSLSYFYTPLTYPKGNISLFEDITFTDFKKKMGIEVIKWENEVRSSYQFVTDKKEIKDLLEQFDNADKLEDYDMDKYLADLPEKDKGTKYNIMFRQLEELDNNLKVGGRVIISFEFYENHDVLEVSDFYFFTLSKRFKEDIYSAISDEEKWITND